MIPLSTSEEIIEAILASPDLEALDVMIQFTDKGPGAGTYVNHIKVVKIHPGRTGFSGHIHEQILGTVQGRIGHVRNPILHSGYDGTAIGQKAKWKRDRKLLWLDLKDDPYHPLFNFNAGMTAFYHHRLRPARGWLKRSVKYCRGGETILRKAYALYGMTELQLGRPQRAMEIYREGLSRVGNDPELRFRIAQLHLAENRNEDAIKELTEMPTSTEGFYASIDLGILTFTRLELLGEAYMRLGDAAKAKESLAKSLEANPHYLPAILRAFDLCCQTADIKGAKGILDHLLRVGGPGEEWLKLHLQLASLLDVPVDEALDRLIRAHPQAIAPKKALSQFILQNGPELAAQPLLRELAARGDAESAFNLGALAAKYGDVDGALASTKRAIQLDPGKALYREQLERILETVEQKELALVQGDRDKKRISGPHVGSLGKAKRALSVIVVTHNSEGTVRKCLVSALDELGPDDEVIVIDNASLDETILVVERLAARDPRVKLMVNRENIGYSKAANQGILVSGGKRLILLNPDAVFAPASLGVLVSRLRGNVAAVGPVSDNVGGIQFAGFHLNGRKPSREELPDVFDEMHAGKTLEAKALMGFCLALRRDILDKYGLLCEETELGADDLELSWRYRELGLKMVVAMDAFVFHEGSHSFTHSPEAEMARVRIRRSDRALVRKLVNYYGWGKVPSSREIWGHDIFCEAFERSGVVSG